MANTRNGTTLLLTALAAHRVTRLVTRDTITEPWREQIFNQWPPTFERSRSRWVPEQQRHVMRAPDDHVPVTKWSTLLECPWCSGFWIVAALVFGQRLPRPVLTTFALSSVVGLIGAADAALA